MTEQKPRRLFGLPHWWALGVGAAVAGIAGVALVAPRDSAPPAPRFTVTAVAENGAAPTAAGPLMTELLRCRSLSAGADDAACREAWEANRRRFIGESPDYGPPRSGITTGKH